MNRPRQARSYTEDDFLAQVEREISAPAHADNPLRPMLSDLLAICQGQRHQLERVIRISDRFQSMAMTEQHSLADECDRHLRRLEKLTRISDRYQHSLHQLKLALEEAALQDPLTGMSNRRHLTQRLDEEVERSMRTQRPLSIALLDLDHFKSVNDRFGHETGDQLLCRIGDSIRASVRTNDACGRWGGEEFLLLLPETDREQVLAVCDRVHRAIESIEPITGMDSNFHVTASVGVASVHAGEGWSAALKRADDLLLKAKQTGRNQLLIAEDEPRSP